HRPKSPQTSQDLSCTAANAQSLTRKALAPCSVRFFLQLQHVVFPQNQLKPAVRCEQQPVHTFGPKVIFRL
ncbi:MAG: hypothetical protein RIK09_00010, partial [Gammaproteobacteria bacterium]